MHTSVLKLGYIHSELLYVSANTKVTYIKKYTMKS